MLKQDLSIGINQHLSLTPHMQQAIKMLLLSTQDLSQEIRQITEANVMLELDEDLASMSPEAPVEAETDESDIPADFYIEPKTKKTDSAYSADSLIDKIDYATDTLRDKLLKDLDLAKLSPLQQAIGLVIIDSINENGYLEIPLEEIQLTLHAQQGDVALEEIEKVLTIIQDFAPKGVGARNLQESLTLQLNRLSEVLPGLNLAKRIVSENLPILAQHNYTKLKSIYKVTEHNIANALNIIKTLKPYPGNIHLKEASAFNMTPDLVTKKINGKWVVMLSNNPSLNLRINNEHSQLANASSPTSQFVRAQWQEAKWIIKCLENRNSTLLKVAECILQYQVDFFEYGAGAMRPLILRDVAYELNLHQSTISRITTNKYMQTPQGTFELKYFFTSHINTDYGKKCSSTAIQSYISNLIKAEDPTKPLTDAMITHNLANKGIAIARRTVTKYREFLKILPASQRKHQAMSCI